MRLRTPPRQGRIEENLIPLINIVFLILIFFLVASTIRSFDIGGISLSQAEADAGPKGKRNVLVISADGSLSYRGRTLSHEDLPAILQEPGLTQGDKPLFIAADAALPAQQLVAVADMARAAGVKQIILVTRKTPK